MRGGTAMEKKKQRPVIRQFIELYKRLPCLWKKQSPQYTDRPMKKAAYNLLAKKLAEAEPGANRLSVVKRINNLRTNYRKEKRKMQAAELEGRKIEPTLWYYPMLGFLEDQDDSNIDAIALEPDQYDDEDDEDDNYGNGNDEDEFSQKETSFELALMEESPSESSRPHEVKPSRKRRYDDMLNTTTNHNHDDQFQITQCQDRHDAFGRNIAFKLRALPDDQRIFAERLINEAIFEAELGNLGRNSRVQLDRTMTLNMNVA